MNLRVLMPKRLRWRMALRYVHQAEYAEQQAERGGDSPSGRYYGEQAIRLYLKAVLWRPIEHPLHLPGPSDEGGAPAPKDQDTIPCVWCGTPIPRARKGQTGTGLYCARCA